MDSPHFSRLARLTFTLGLLGMALAGWLSIHSIRSFVAAADQSRLSREINSKLDDIRNPVKDAETARLGFLLSGEEAYLNDYRGALPLIAAEIRNLESLLAGDGELHTYAVQLEPLISLKIEELERTVALESRGQHAAALRSLKNASGQGYLHRIMGLLQNIDTVEERQYLEQSRRAQRAGRQTIRLLWITGGLSLSLLALAIFFSQRQMAARFRSEAELRRSQDIAVRASAQKSRFLALMSHEIRTPLNGIIGSLELLSSSGLNAEQRRLTDLLGSSATGLLSLINDLLDISRIEAGKIEIDFRDFDLRATVNRCAELFAPQARKKGLALTTAIDPRLPATLQGDPARLAQVLMNLVGNAVKFTDQGRIHVTARAVSKDDANPVRIAFAVEDTGRGISSRQREQLFKPFARLRDDRVEGTGLGLAISKSLVEAMNGELTLESTTGRGSTFAFTLSLGNRHAQPAPAPAPAPPAPVATEPAAAAPSPHRILLVEDNPTNQILLMTQLERLGYAARVAESGAAALAALEAEPFDLILMDCRLPGPDGFEVTRRIRQGADRPSIPILALTANAVTGDRERCLGAGMDDYLAKPVTSADLERALRKWLPRPREPEASIDSAALRRLSEQTNPSLARRVIETYLAHLGGYALRLAEAFGSQDLKALHFHAHTLRSSSLSVGARGLAAWCEAVERSDRLPSTADGRRLRDELASLTSLTRAGLEAASGQLAQGASSATP